MFVAVYMVRRAFCDYFGFYLSWRRHPNKPKATTNERRRKMLKHFAIWHIHINPRTAETHSAHTNTHSVYSAVLKISLKDIFIRNANIRIWFRKRNTLEMLRHKCLVLRDSMRSLMLKPNNYFCTVILAHCVLLFGFTDEMEPYTSHDKTKRCKCDWQGIGAATISIFIVVWHS